MVWLADCHTAHTNSFLLFAEWCIRRLRNWRICILPISII